MAYEVQAPNKKSTMDRNNMIRFFITSISDVPLISSLTGELCKDFYSE
jgi:hypothetical protein